MAFFKRGVGLVGIVLLGAGCVQAENPLLAGQESRQQVEMVSPYATQVDTYDDVEIVPYQADSDLSRIAKQEAVEKAPMKDGYKETITQTEVTKPMKWEFPGALPAADRVGKTVVMETTKGVIEFEVFGEEAPLASSNFIYLTKGGYYDGLTFHRREEGFVIQGGDPRGNGTGGPGYQFEDEPVKRSYDRGIVAMANAGPDTNGSQFFIMLDDVGLPPNYTIFGKVTKGMEVVDAIKVGDKMTKVTVK